MSNTKYPEFSEKMTSQIGKTLTYSDRKGIETTGVCDKIRWSGSYITNMSIPNDPKWAGFELRLKPIDGSRAIWTKAFPSDVLWPQYQEVV